MSLEEFKVKFWGIIVLILFLSMFGLLYYMHTYFGSTATHPKDEEEKENLLEDYPEGVPPRFWN